MISHEDLTLITSSVTTYKGLTNKIKINKEKRSNNKNKKPEADDNMRCSVFYDDIVAWMMAMATATTARMTAKTSRYVRFRRLNGGKDDSDGYSRRLPLLFQRRQRW